MFESKTIDPKVVSAHARFMALEVHQVVSTSPHLIHKYEEVLVGGSSLRMGG